MLQLTKQIVATMSAIPPESALWSSHPEVLKAFEGLRRIYAEYESNSDSNLENWTKFFGGLRTELVEFMVRIGPVVEGWEEEAKQR